MKYCIVQQKENYLIKSSQGKIISSCQTLAEAQAQLERFQAKLETIEKSKSKIRKR